MKTTVASFRAAKGERKLAMLTCYDFSMARLMAAAELDALLVGDSLGMVMLGYEDTVPVTLEEMIHHSAAVARGAGDCLVICDMPFLSSQCGIQDTVRNAGRLLKEGHAQAVKLEGGAEFAPEIAALVRASIPVMGHIGLMPQSVNAIGGFRVQGRDEAAARKLLADARAIEAAGAFAMVLECVPHELAAEISRAVTIPVIGIGAGPDCDGQVLVWQDMLNVTASRKPKFVRVFADAGELASRAFQDYRRAVEDGSFPSAAECYQLETAADKKQYLV